MDEHDVPFALFNQLDGDRDGTSATLADTVRVLADAAAARGRGPAEDLEGTLEFPEYRRLRGGRRLHRPPSLAATVPWSETRRCTGGGSSAAACGSPSPDRS